MPMRRNGQPTRQLAWRMDVFPDLWIWGIDIQPYSAIFLDIPDSGIQLLLVISQSLWWPSGKSSGGSRKRRNTGREPSIKFDEDFTLRKTALGQPQHSFHQVVPTCFREVWWVTLLQTGMHWSSADHGTDVPEFLSWPLWRTFLEQTQILIVDILDATLSWVASSTTDILGIAYGYMIHRDTLGVFLNNPTLRHSWKILEVVCPWVPRVVQCRLATIQVALWVSELSPGLRAGSMLVSRFISYICT